MNQYLELGIMKFHGLMSCKQLSQSDSTKWLKKIREVTQDHRFVLVCFWRLAYKRL